jgi:hypothetical protein
MKFLYSLLGLLILFASCSDNVDDRKKKIVNENQSLKIIGDTINKLDIKLYQNDFKFNWYAHEANFPIKEKKKIIQELREEFEVFFEVDKFEGNPFYNLYECLHFIDIDNDSDLDMIFEGWSGAEATVVKIFINKKGNYTKCFEAFQQIGKIEFDKFKRIQFITILDRGCCAEFVRFETRYKFDRNLNTSIVSQRVTTNNLSLPPNNFDQPIYFRTNFPIVNLREDPFVNDTSLTMNETINGNKIATFPFNSKGKIWAEMMDSKKKKWCLVEMDYTPNLTNNVTYSRDSIQNKLIGWMSKRNLKIVE